MKERLIELLQEYTDNNNGGGSNHGLAEHLLANGVIVPPCKVGDMVYFPWEYDGQSGIAHNEVESIKIYCNNFPIIVVEDWESDMPMPISFSVQDFGKTVFLTKEEAEAALERCEGIK